ncbi:relaxase/mobilization nuclease domain-containing protein [Streptomyces paromomycinus]|uniref:Mobilization protein n=1 Tax=Streptomyces paromomycinus TaxID=92743 RepID=A0A401W5W9_STREY|nr:relaxase/mobilization nuclease domain-containing protein [Streptomyces paromomycinus]GCD44706.1 mobilization protein [Streptomyces paromomycinus]
MIAKIGSGKDTAGLIRYLYDPGRANEHTDPHLVASWDGFAPDPGRTENATVVATRKLLAADLDLHVKQARRLGRAPKQHVWHCSVRAAPDDRTLSDAEWATIARRVVAATGIAPDGDPDGCRWVAVRHADDHIHIAATTVRGDLRPARHWNDYLTADKELAAIEQEYGLQQVRRGDRTAAKRPTRAEREKARRGGHATTAREHLRTTARTAVSVATSTEEFLGILMATDNVLVETQRFPSGDLRGYKLALKGDTNAAGEPIWYSGSKLAPDLSLPKIQQRLEATTPQPKPGRGRPSPWHQAITATEGIPEFLDQADDEAAQAHLAAFGEALDALPLLAPQNLRPQLRQAAAVFERATRSRIQAEHHHARTLRSVLRAMLREPAPKDGAALAMLLDAALLVALAATRWHHLRHHDQQATAAQQTHLHLQAAYDKAAPAPLAAIAHRKPAAPTIERFVALVRETVPAHAQQVLDDHAWDALATTLADAETTGHQPASLLQQAADQHTLSDARSPARTLTWRIHRLTQYPAAATRTRATTGTRPSGRAGTEPRTPHQPPTVEVQRRHR